MNNIFKELKKIGINNNCIEFSDLSPNLKGYKFKNRIDFIGSVHNLQTIFYSNQINKLNISDEIINGLKDEEIQTKWKTLKISLNHSQKDLKLNLLPDSIKESWMWIEIILNNSQLTLESLLAQLNANVSNLLSVKLSYNSFFPSEFDSFTEVSKLYTASYEAWSTAIASNNSIYQKICTFYYKLPDSIEWKWVFAENLQVNFNSKDSIIASTFDSIIFNSNISIKVNWMKWSRPSIDQMSRLSKILDKCNFANNIDERFTDKDFYIIEKGFAMVLDWNNTLWHTIQISNEVLAREMKFYYSKTWMVCIQSEMVGIFTQNILKTIEGKIYTSFEYWFCLQISNSTKLICLVIKDKISEYKETIELKPNLTSNNFATLATIKIYSNV